MRIAPVAFHVDPYTVSGRQLIRDVCRITHHNEEAYVAALAVVLAIRKSLVASTVLPPGAIADHLPDSVVRDRLKCYSSEGVLSIAQAAKIFGSSAHAAESVPFAIFAAHKMQEFGFAESLQEVIEVGGDTDTNASIAGQIAGVVLGASNLPYALIAGLPDNELVHATAERFCLSVIESWSPVCQDGVSPPPHPDHL
jgi:ADP-ribosylglycohydrolase